MWRLDQKLGVQTPITPKREKGAEAARFNWTPPIVLSPHNPAIVYTAAQVVFRSLDRGDRWTEISPDLTTNDKARQGGAGYIFFCTITTLSESPVKPGVLWAGADDGKVQVTTNGGVSWTDVTSKLAAAGAPAGMWVSRVFASPHDAGTAFVAKNGLPGGRGKSPYLQDGRFRRDLDSVSAGTSRTSPSMSSSRTGRTRTCSSRAPTVVSTRLLTAGRAGSLSRTTCPGSR